MKRKTIAIIFLFMANILLMATVVIPHHHHNDSICFQVNHCHGNDHHNHEHDSNNDLDCCQLHHEIVLPSSFVSIDAGHLLQNIPWEAPDLITINISQLFQASSILKFSDEAIAFSQFFLTSSWSLRAPPAV